MTEGVGRLPDPFTVSHESEDTGPVRKQLLFGVAHRILLECPTPTVQVSMTACNAY